MHGSTCRTPQTRTTRRNSRCLGFPEMGNVLLVVRLTVAIVAIVEILCDTAVADLIIEVRDGIEPTDIAKLSVGQGVLVDGEKAFHPVRVNVPFREPAMGEMDFLVRFFKLDILIEDTTHAKSPLFLRTDFIARYPARCGSSPFRAHRLRARSSRSPCRALRPQGSRRPLRRHALRLFRPYRSPAPP